MQIEVVYVLCPDVDTRRPISLNKTLQPPLAIESTVEWLTFSLLAILLYIIFEAKTVVLSLYFSILILSF